MTVIRKLIAEAESWREYYRARGAHIEAAACSIRIKALLDALAALQRGTLR